RRAAPLPLPLARPGRDARALQRDRRRAQPAPHRLPRLVRDADVPPVPAAASVEEAARGDRLDRLAAFPPRHCRARDARPPTRAGRWLRTSPVPTPSWPAATCTG